MTDRPSRTRATAARASRMGVIVAVVMLIVFGSIGAAPVQAASQSYSPACDGVNVRTSPSTSATIKTKLGLGATLTVSGSVSGSAWSTICPTAKSGSSWYTISHINGTSVSSLYGVGVLYAATGVLQLATSGSPSPTPTPSPAPSTTTAVPACSSINLRAGTSTTTTLVARLVSGDTATVDATVSGSAWSAVCPTSKSGSSWYRITHVNGQTVAARYGVSVVYAATGVLTIVSSPTPTPTPSGSPYVPACDGINLRTGTSTSTTIAVRLGLSNVVTVSGSVSGSAWSTTCPTAKSGSSWYTISHVNGTSVSSLYGVSVLYAATGVLVPKP